MKSKADISRPLLRWYSKNRRDLPWRKNPEPYRIWISEVMLQQTRMEVVVPRYLRFIRRFPHVNSLATAREEEVLSEWSGLGYYRRARALHRAARVLVADHDGEFPRDLSRAEALPGVGRYTAGAVLSIAYNLPVPLLDGNVKRVLSRLFRVEGDPRHGPAERQLWSLAREVLPERSASRFNQALMELGALVCLPRTPRCEACPLRRLCGAYRSGTPERYPERGQKRELQDVALFAAVIERRGRFLLERRGDSGSSYLRGLWGFPMVESPLRRGPATLLRHLRAVSGGNAMKGELLGEIRHSITFRRIKLRVHRFQLEGRVHSRSGVDGSRCSWSPLGELGTSLPASSLALKIKSLLESLLETESQGRGP